MKKLKVYLAGSWSCPEKYLWRQNFVEKTGVIGLNPFGLSRKYSEEEYFALDIKAIKECGLVVVYANTTAVTTGTAQEIVFAKFYNKPVLAVITDSSPSRSSETKNLHFFLKFTCDHVFETIEECITHIKTNSNNTKNLNDLDLFIEKIYKEKKIFKDPTVINFFN